MSPVLKSGAEGVVQQTAAAWGEPLDIDQGALCVGSASGTRTLSPPPELALPPMPPVGTDPRQQSPKWQMLTKLELPGYVRLCEGFRALIEGREPPQSVPLPTFADGLACMDVLDAIRAFAANGGALTYVGGTGSA